MADRFTKTAMNRGELEGFVRDEEFVHDTYPDVVDFAWLQRHRARFLESEHQERFEKRRLIEHTSRHFKHNRDFRRVLLRGLSGARIETFLVAAASLLRRLCNILRRDGRTWPSLARTPGSVGPRAV